jgi:KDO2-lipid IV(A) lauroyltransferase
MPLWLKRFLRRIGVFVLSWLARFSGRNGVAGVQKAGDWLGRVHYRLRPFTTRRLRRHMSRLGGAPAAAPADHLKEAFRQCDRAAFEILALGSGAIRREELAATVDPGDIDRFRPLLERGQGVLLLGLHMGNGVAFVLHLAQLGLPMNVVSYNSRKMGDQFFQKALDSENVQVISARPERAAFYGLARALKGGRAIFITMDQMHKRGGVPAHFLGKDVLMPGGPAALARSLNVPIFPVLATAAEPKWAFSVEPAVELPEPGDLEADVACLTEVMDRHIRAYPQLWSWDHRRWLKEPFPDEARDRIR